jgi:hypothetical protein
LFRHRIGLDIKIDELQKIIMNICRWRCNERMETINNEWKVTKNDCIRILIGKQHKVWDPGRLQEAIVQQQDNQASGQLQSKVLDLGRE